MSEAKHAAKQTEKQKQKPAAAPRRLFECFIVVGLETRDDPKNPFTPVIRLQYPEAANCVEIPRDLPQFCFPEVLYDQILSHKVSCYSFVLTDADGQQQFGFCRRIMPAPKSNQKPLCLCLLTRFPYFSLYSNMLVMLENLYSHKQPHYCLIPESLPIPVTNFLKSVLKYPFPLPGESFIISTPEGIEYRLVRPDDDDSPLADVTFTPLFASMHLNQILSLFAAVLSERRIILMSSSLSKLSSCCHATAAMIYPFNWQHIFIPVLPKKLMDYCTAPMPFLIGLQASCLPILQRMPIEEVYMVDLDAKIDEDVGLDPGSLPLSPLSSLRSNLIKVMARWNRSASIDDAAVASCFLSFFVSIFGNYRQYLREEGPKYILNRDSFVNNSPPQYKQFLEEFRHCQMFERFAAERESIVAAAMEGHHVTGAFERYIASKSANQSTGYLSSLKVDMSGKLSSLKGMVKTMNISKQPNSPNQPEKQTESIPESASGRKLSKIMSYVTDLQTTKTQKSPAQTNPTQTPQGKASAQTNQAAPTTTTIGEFEFVEEDSAPEYAPIESKLRSFSSSQANQKVARSQSAVDLLSFDDPTQGADTQPTKTAGDMNRSATTENLLDFDFDVGSAPAQQSSRSASTSTSTSMSSGVPTGVDIWDLMGSTTAAQTTRQGTTQPIQGQGSNTNDLLDIFSSPAPQHQNPPRESGTIQKPSDLLIDF